MKRLIALGSAALIALTGLAPRAHAAVVDTFSYSNFGNWPLADTGFSGQFTGTVEPDGFIELSAFSLEGVVLGSPVITADKAALAFFSYDTTGAASSLGFIVVSEGSVACSGAPSVLAPQCNPDGVLLASTRAFMFGGGFFGTTPDQTAVTLVSSVSTPEPSTWAMILTGLAGLGLLGARRARKGRASPRAGRSPA